MELIRYLKGSGSENKVGKEQIRKPGVEAAGEYFVGDVIERDSRGCGDWYCGKITNEYKNTRGEKFYDIEYNVVYRPLDATEISRRTSIDIINGEGDEVNDFAHDVQYEPRSTCISTCYNSSSIRYTVYTDSLYIYILIG